MLSEQQIKRLKEYATKSNVRFKHASAVLDSNGRIICMGYNRSTDRDSIHAEVDCLRKYIRAYLPRGYVAVAMVNIRVNPKGKLMNSLPCSRCESYVKTVFDIPVYSLMET